MKSQKLLLSLSTAAMMLACIAPVSAIAETTHAATQVSKDLSIIYQAS